MAVPEPLRTSLLGLATSRPARRVLRPLVRHHVAIMMLHRFADTERGIGGHDPALLRAALFMLRKEGVPLLSLRETVAGLRAGEPIEGIAFTIDDGYDDFATSGAPVFQEFDCPATVFLATGFLDGHDWNWWDKVDYALVRSKHLPDELTIAEQTRIPLRTPADRQAAYQRIIGSLKQLSEYQRQAEVAKIIAEMQVDMPREAPHQRAPLTWSTVRKLQDSGIDFGPHTVTHPHLTTMTEDEVRWEIGESYRRLREELADPVPIFCYPFGQPQDLCDTVTRAARAAGLDAALTAVPGYVSSSVPALDLYRLPRFSLPGNLVDLRQITGGFERLKHIIRSAVSLDTRRDKTRFV